MTVSLGPFDTETLGTDWWREIEGRWTVVEPSGLLDPDDDHPHAGEPNLELLEVLLCPSCDMELSSAPCSPVHALLQDNPGQHRLIMPIVEAAIYQIRHDTTKICNICPGKIPIATRDCPHVVDRHGQVWMSKVQWEKLVAEVKDTREEMAEMEDRNRDYADNVLAERERLVADRQRWATAFALEKFEELLEEMDFEGFDMTNGMQETLVNKFEAMLSEKTDDD